MSAVWCLVQWICLVAYPMDFDVPLLSTEQSKQCLNIWVWLKGLYWLTQHMLLLWQGMDWIIELKIRQKHDCTVHRSQSEGHLPVVPYCTYQLNTCLWPLLLRDWLRKVIRIEHSDKPTVSRNLNSNVRLKAKHIPDAIRWQSLVQSALNFVAQCVQFMLADVWNELFQNLKHKVTMDKFKQDPKISCVKVGGVFGNFGCRYSEPFLRV